jgi:hypothetical protein
MWPPSFEPCHDLTPADWLLPRLLPWGLGGALVTNIIPMGFDAYVRVFHPAGAGPLHDPVSWHQVADWSGRVFHPLAQFEKMSIPARSNPAPPPFDSAPWLGRLIPPVCDVLVGELAKLTQTPSTCYFAIWDGNGILYAGSSTMVRAVPYDDDESPDDQTDFDAALAAWRRDVAGLPRFEHPYRNYLLGRGPIGMASELDRHPLAPGSWQTLGLPPQLWWPEDRAWVVASEIDFDSTLVATTIAGAEALIACEGIEALLVPSDGRLDFNGDDLNLS